MIIYEENGLYVIEPSVYKDDRGYFLESHSNKYLLEAGLNLNFIQDNISKSNKGVLRGLHYQLEYPQGKVVRCIQGEVLDVSVDIRIGSPTFGQVNSKILNDKNNISLYIPIGFAHGFCVLSEEAIFHYKCTEYYYQDDQQGILWNSIDLNWPVKNPLVSEKDQILLSIEETPKELLFTYE
jgi:dTDP-4-dehydrorhamnose 3,5-epimerase|tara:strand:+ start:2107 stop:2649 length:543 start_codon:yes stop_codon:yes gene_type:complete